MEYRDSDLFMPTSRIETLVDGIFAIAMTILVLNLSVPAINGTVTSALFQSAVFSIWPDVLSFVLSFVLLGVFWNIHHRTFHQIEKVDKILLWINMIWLLFIVLVPFSNTLTGGDYGQFPLAHFIFNLNMLGIAVFLSLNWFYAVRRGLIYKKVNLIRVSIYKRVYVSFILITLLAMGFSFIIPHWSSIVYVLIIPMEYLIEKQMKS